MQVKVICLFDLRREDSPHLMQLHYFGERIKRRVLSRGEIFENTKTLHKQQLLIWRQFFFLPKRPLAL